ncbi:MAG: hypothetical protein U9N34_01470 [Candidatus Cloacimonadota bacterium]|nr:hypothetical protein [Candidatus Cloacimonadota bacterium]
MKTELDILFDVTNKLKSLGIEYMLTGSLAMNFYAEPRMTRDLDIVLLLNVDKIKPLIKSFKYDYYISEEGISDALKHNTSFNLIHNTSIMKVDMILRKNDAYRVSEFQRKQEIDLLANQIYICAKEDLIISKLIWSLDSKSEKQKTDILNLLQTDYDANYLHRWLKKLNLSDFYEGFINE